MVADKSALISAPHCRWSVLSLWLFSELSLSLMVCVCPGMDLFLFTWDLFCLLNPLNVIFLLFSPLSPPGLPDTLIKLSPSSLMTGSFAHVHLLENGLQVTVRESSAHSALGAWMEARNVDILSPWRELLCPPYLHPSTCPALTTQPRNPQRVKRKRHGYLAWPLGMLPTKSVEQA